jgi:hypothetical protein
VTSASTDERLDAVRIALAEPLDDADVGASAAVFVDGEVVRRVTGQSLATFFASHIAGPLGAGFHLTMPAGAGLDGGEVNETMLAAYDGLG